MTDKPTHWTQAGALVEIFCAAAEAAAGQDAGTYESLPVQAGLEAVLGKLEPAFHQAIAPLLSKRDQGRVMGAWRRALGELHA